MRKDFGLDPTGPAGPPPLTKGRLKERIIVVVRKPFRPPPKNSAPRLTKRRGANFAINNLKPLLHHRNLIPLIDLRDISRLVCKAHDLSIRPDRLGAADGQ